MPVYNSGYKPWKMPLKEWQVVTVDGSAHDVTAHYCFNNGAEGLVFRAYSKGEDKSTVVAAFAQGSWHFYKEITDDQI